MLDYLGIGLFIYIYKGKYYKSKYTLYINFVLLKLYLN